MFLHPHEWVKLIKEFQELDECVNVWFESRDEEGFWVVPMDIEMGKE